MLIYSVLAEQKQEKANYNFKNWVSRREEDLFEMDSTLAQVVIGVRRSGKSTVCHKVLMEHHVNYGFANFDDDRLASLGTEDLNTVLSCIYQLYGVDVKYIFLDEVQSVEGWYLFVNRLLRTGVRIFVTGSNAKLLSGELATHLTGRYNEIRLYPFSFREYCEFKKLNVNPITTKEKAACKVALNEYLTNGGFPEMVTLRNKRGYTVSLIEAVLKKDIQRRFRVRDPELLRLTASHLMSNMGQVVNFDNLSKMLKLSDKTLRKYVGYLCEAFLIKLLTKYSFKSTERLREPKSYVVDVGFLSNRDDALALANLGWRLENVVYIELLRRCAREFNDVYYYKPNPRAKEVDFVVCDMYLTKELVQVAYDITEPKTLNRETSSLVNAAAALKCEKLTLISLTESRDVNVDGRAIRIRSAVDWLLEDI